VPYYSVTTKSLQKPAASAKAQFTRYFSRKGAKAHPTFGTRTPSEEGRDCCLIKQGIVLLKDHPGISEHSVFIRLLSEFSKGSVKAKIAGELKGRQDKGQFICYFEHLSELQVWSYDELKGIMGGR
jgi:hypothetical protein